MIETTPWGQSYYVGGVQVTPEYRPIGETATEAFERHTGHAEIQPDEMLER